MKAVPTVELHCNQEFLRLAFSRLIYAGACLCNAAEQSPRFLIMQHWLSLAERSRWLWNQRYPFMLDQPDAMIPSMLREIALRSCIAMQNYRRLWDSSVENGKCL
ncbi:hypothetical protein H0E87_002269 [Populus deltoides]|uniref:Uncharacterized protein n=1 Tax=Populus deltoides TaxID=3696 RepID=A0A8T2ZUA7_POPDE|nr:hypothetical protein H0E87_002269 [Populus deltoides]